jgi:hypothetical protein
VSYYGVGHFYGAVFCACHAVHFGEDADEHITTYDSTSALDRFLSSLSTEFYDTGRIAYSNAIQNTDTILVTHW